MTGSDRVTHADVVDWGEPTFYDYRGAAARVGRSVSTIYRWKDRGLIHPIAGRVQTAELLEVDRITRARGGDQARLESNERMLTRRDAAERVRRSERTIRDWVHRHDLPMLGGRIPIGPLLEIAAQMNLRIGRLPG